jgi:choline dehydrogenase
MLSRGLRKLHNHLKALKVSDSDRWAHIGMNEIGINTAQDFNSGSLLGCQFCSTTISPAHEFRDSSESSFLTAASSRPNLTIYNGTLAKKILFSGTTATGVEISIAGVTSVLQANKEVIVSAGAFQSPQILIVSGIGPEETLQEFNIPCVANRPGVGQGMQDHVFFGPSYRVNLLTHTRLATVSQDESFTTTISFFPA